jgi:NAD-dependent DNA ligase
MISDQNYATKYSQTLDKLADLGFPIWPLLEKVEAPQGCLNYVTRIRKIRSDLDYSIDCIQLTTTDHP